jgi:hypothetical protein
MDRQTRVAVRDALEKIALMDENGRLRPEAVLEDAENPESPLHGCFTWDDGEAAYRWRLNEARMLIRTSYTVVVEQQAVPIKTRAFVSLKSARTARTGYTPIRRVLSEPELHAELLRNALEDLEAMERRYGHLRELKAVFSALRRVRRRVPRQGYSQVSAR